MGLITKEVEVKINPANVKYLESKGYIIPMALNKRKKTMPEWGKTVMVKVEDLSNGSHSIVDIEYDCCHTFSNMEYKTYKNFNHNGKIYCQHCNSKILNSRENHYLYKKDKTDEERLNGRAYPEYIQFVKTVLARDNYTCQCCGKKHIDLEVHHLDGYDWCKERRTDDTNGICLCANCHKAFHNKFGCGGNTKQQYEEWIGYTIEILKKYDGKLNATRQVFDYERNEVFESARSYAKIFDVQVSEVRRCCNHTIRKQKYIDKNDNIKFREIKINTVKGHHLFWFDEYENISKDDLLKFIENRKCKRYRKNICITTGKFFKKIREAAETYNVAENTITLCCQEKRKTAGKLPDGTPLQWMYYEDFLKLPIEEQNEILARNQESSTDDSFIM